MADSAPIPAPLDAPLRERLLSQPEMILEDRDLMKALIAANQRAMGMNVVDLRGIAMERLEARLDRLEDTHRSVIAAAYENLAGTNQVHRAVLAVLEPAKFEEFLAALGGPVAEILRLDAVRLVLETRQRSDDPSIAPALSKAGEVLFVADPGFVDGYLSGPRGAATRPVVLRQTRTEGEGIYGDKTGWIRSEAVARLDLGPGRLPAALAMGSEDPHHFRANQGTDLLAFFAGVFERAMRRWLA